MNPASKAKVEYCVGRNRNALKVAIENGVRIATGTDVGVWDTWGDNMKVVLYTRFMYY